MARLPLLDGSPRPTRGFLLGWLGLSVVVTSAFAVRSTRLLQVAPATFVALAVVGIGLAGVSTYALRGVPRHSPDGVFELTLDDVWVLGVWAVLSLGAFFLGTVDVACTYAGTKGPALPFGNCRSAFEVAASAPAVGVLWLAAGLTVAFVGAKLAVTTVRAGRRALGPGSED